MAKGLVFVTQSLPYLVGKSAPTFYLGLYIYVSLSLEMAVDIGMVKFKFMTLSCQ